MPADPDEQIDNLYAVPLDEFVERRDELARSLRKEGDRQGADEVKALRKPTVPAWTVNQLARREKMRLRGLFAAGERLRKVHEELLGGGSPEALQQARDDERRAIAELLGAAGPPLTEAGHPLNESTLDRIGETLHAAAADEGIGRRVREGRLDKEEQVTGFGFGNLPAAPAKRGTRAKREARPKAEATAKLDRRSKAKEEAAREKGARERKAKQVEAAREQHRRAEERLSNARRAVKEADRAVKSQARELDRAEGELKKRQADMKSAEREVERARQSLES